jgi:hypothetical protein
MKLFSQRKGMKPARVGFQIDSVDAPLRNTLWNVLDAWFWSKSTAPTLSNNYQSPFLCDVVKSLWDQYFQSPWDTIPDLWKTCYSDIRKYFFSCEWYEVYDFVEFLQQLLGGHRADEFRESCNSILEQGFSAYRFVGNEIAQITSAEEISSIEDTLNAPPPLKPVRLHIEQALKLLSDRTKPDYRNSIKESISAIESLSWLISKNKKGGLPETLRVVGSQAQLHPAQIKAFEILYGYTSDASGIRHALLDEPSLGFEDAKFMLVSCSAFVNYIVVKLAKAGFTF